MMKKQTPLFAGLCLGFFAFLAIIFLVFLPSVFSGGKTLDPIAFTVGPFAVRWYGLLIASGALIAYLLVDYESRKTKIALNSIESIVFISLFLGLIGARIGFIIQNVTFFRADPMEMLRIYHGGLSIHGAIAGGLLSLLISAKYFKVKFLDLANLIFPPVLLAISIGRWGNFFNQEIIGQPATVPWKMYVNPDFRPEGFTETVFFHPVFLYESLSLLLIFIIYWRFLRKKQIGLVYTLTGYCAVRTVVEFWRIDYKPIFAGFDLAQLVSLGIIVAVLLPFLLKKRSLNK